MSSIVVCPDCFEENVKGSVRCARCGVDFSATRQIPRQNAEAPLTIGGMPFNRAAMEEIVKSRAPRRITILGVLAVVAVLIAVLQLSPTMKRAPTQVRNLRTTLVTSHAIYVAWTSSDTYSNGLSFFALQAVETSSGGPQHRGRLLSTTSGSFTGLLRHTNYVITVTSFATNNTHSPTAVIYVTTQK